MFFLGVLGATQKTIVCHFKTTKEVETKEKK
jgi:hypothetical protein